MWIATGESFKKKYFYRGAWLALGLSVALAHFLTEQVERFLESDKGKQTQKFGMHHVK